MLDDQSETSAIWERGDGRGKQGVFSIFTTLEGSKIHILLLFGGSKSVISKRSVISNPRLGYGLFDGSVLQDTNECVSALTGKLSRLEYALVTSVSFSKQN